MKLFFILNVKINLFYVDIKLAVIWNKTLDLFRPTLTNINLHIRKHSETYSGFHMGTHFATLISTYLTVNGNFRHMCNERGRSCSFQHKNTNKFLSKLTSLSSAHVTYSYMKLCHLGHWIGSYVLSLTKVLCENLCGSHARTCLKFL